MLNRRVAVSFLAAAVAVAIPAAARADSIVYLKGGQVWVANADGLGARQFTVHPYGWSSPSQADDGTIVVAGGLSRVNADGSDSDGSSELYRFAPDGNQIGGFTPTYGSRSTPACPAYPPSSVRVSPDGTKIAYGIYACGAGGEQVALWTPAGSTTLNFPSQTRGQVDFWEPAWIDSSRFTVSHAGVPTGAHFGEHLVTDPDNSGAGWSEAAMSDRPGEAVISRSGKEAVVFYNDAASYLDGKPRHVDLWVYSNPTMPPNFTAGWPDPPAGCKFVLDATKVGDVYNLSPSLSPDGSKVLWGDDTGVQMLALGDVTSACVGHGAPVLLVPGGSQPFYGKGNVAAGAANPNQPGGTTTTTTTTTTTQQQQQQQQQTVLTPVARFRLATKHPRAKRKVVFDAGQSAEPGGKLVLYSWSFGDGKRASGRKVTHKFRKPGTYKVRLTVRDASGRQATVSHKVKVKR
jgi:hypothetical protein